MQQGQHRPHRTPAAPSRLPTAGVTQTKPMPLSLASMWSATRRPRRSRARTARYCTRRRSGTSSPGSIYQTSEMRISANLHRDRAAHRPRSRAFVAELIRDHPLDGLQALGGRGRRHDVPLRRSSRYPCWVGRLVQRRWQLAPRAHLPVARRAGVLWRWRRGRQLRRDGWRRRCRVSADRLAGQCSLRLSLSLISSASVS